MEYFGSFVAMAAVPYFIGFVTMCFWWRLWLLLPVGSIVALFTGWQYSGALADDGPGLAVGILLAFFAALGAGAGFIASVLVLIARATTSRILHPAAILPSVFAIGFGIPLLFYHAHAKERDAALAPPPETCFDRMYAARFGDLVLALPSAPGLTFFKKGSSRMYGLAHNPDVRSRCSESSAEVAELRHLSMSLQGLSLPRTPQATEFFCSRKHPEYPWAEIVCRTANFTKLSLNQPLWITVEMTNRSVEWPTSERKRIGDHTTSTTSDGLTIHAGKRGVLLQRPDGYLASCNSMKMSKSSSYLHCNAQEQLTATLTVSYQFNTTEVDFLQATPLISSTARMFIQSLQHRPGPSSAAE